MSSSDPNCEELDFLLWQKSSSDLPKWSQKQRKTWQPFGLLNATVCTLADQNKCQRYLLKITAVAPPMNSDFIHQ